MNKNKKSNGEGQFVLQVSSDDSEVAYLRLPTHPPGLCKITRTIRIGDLIGSYVGPDVALDFDSEGVLVGIEIV